MKQHLFSLALGVMMLTACTSEEVIDVNSTQSNAIGFANVVNKSSRVVEGDLTNAEFDNFLVYGYYTKPGMSTPIQIFNGLPVQKTVETVDGKKKTKWTYNDVRYWVPGCTYYFYAYSCADVALSNGNGSPAFSLFDGTNPTVDDRALTLKQYLCDSNHQHDLVTAENENILATEKGNPEVSLGFTHALSKMKAVFSTDFPKGYKVYISNVFISSFYNRADFNVGTGSWSNWTGDLVTPPSIILNVDKDAYVENAAGSEVTTSEAFVIPKLYDTKTSENVKLHFTITVVKEGETILERSIIGTWSPQWVKGNIYRYNINITGSSAGIEPIVFAAEQTLSGTGSWDSSTQLNMVFGVDTGVKK